MKGILVLLCLLSLVTVSCSYIGLGGDDETVEATDEADREFDDEDFDSVELGPELPEELDVFDSVELGPELPDAPEFFESAVLGPELPDAFEAILDVLTPEELERVRAFLSSLRGEKGTRGEIGPQGDQGSIGPQGPEGSQGRIGLPGNEGPTGPQGSPGLQGNQGFQGIQGETGFKGNDGLKGERGDKGLRGDKGATGDKGPVGDQGVKGLTGEPGGPKGDAGPTGPAGPQGIKGAQGDKGDQGDQGGLRRYERVVTLDDTEAEQKVLDAECTGDDRVVMGGGFQFDDDRVIVYESLPRIDGKGWRVRARGPDEFWQLRVYAICIFDEENADP